MNADFAVSPIEGEPSWFLAEGEELPSEFVEELGTRFPISGVFDADFKSCGELLESGGRKILFFATLLDQALFWKLRLPGSKKLWFKIKTRGPTPDLDPGAGKGAKDAWMGGEGSWEPSACAVSLCAHNQF